MHLGFPIAVLDLETDKIKSWTRDALQKERPLLVGVLVASAPGRTSYKAYAASQLKQLGKFLEAFKGPILSYNGLSFDFLVLEKRVEMRRIIPKSFDLFYWLKSQVGMVKGSRLEDLSQMNLGTGKSGSWVEGIRAWKAGYKKPMFRYNRTDCLLPLKLVQKLLRQGYLVFQGRKVRLGLEARAQLDGRASQVAYDAWLAGSEFNRANRIKESFEESDGNYWDVMLEAMGYDESAIKRFGADNLLKSHTGTNYVSCPCGKFYSIGWTEWPGFRDSRDVDCPICGRSLGNFDVDHLSEISREDYYLNGERACPKHRTRLRLVRHVAYKPGSEEWDVLRCARCRKTFQVATS